MQKFVVKKSKSAPLATTPAKQPLQMTKTALLKPQQNQTNDDKNQILPSRDVNKNAVTAAAVKTNATQLQSFDNNNSTACCRSPSNGMTKTTATITTQGTVIPIIKTNQHYHPTRSSTSPSLVASNVKMSGYLKKKRNKMGGWRKLWFVLQNQLLLSYSSKEDYERKLAPFKDVLNLVPGTVIRPTKGPRFTIETSTNLIYTFRCDNTNECSEWITALVESLGLNTGDSNKLANASSKLHFSMENLSKGNSNSRRITTTTSSSSSTSAASSFMSSRSCDSIYRGPTIEIKAEPIQQNTFIISQTRPQQQKQQQQQQQSHQKEQNITKMMTTKKTENQTEPDDAKCNKITRSAQNFRLHPNAPENLQTKQSYEVYQINRMFNADSKGRMLESNGNGNGNGNEIDIVRHGIAVNEVQQQSRKSSRRHHHHHHHHRHQHRDIVKEEEPYLLDNNFNNKNLIVTMADKQILLANGNW